MRARYGVSRCCCGSSGGQIVTVGALAGIWTFWPDAPDTDAITAEQFGARFGEHAKPAPPAAGARASSYLYTQPLAIPQGATILSADLRVDFLSRAALSAQPTLIVGFSGDSDANIALEDTDGASQLTTNGQCKGATRTSTVNWQELFWTYPIGSQIITPDFAVGVQAVVNRSGWSSGNRMNLFIDENMGSPVGYSFYFYAKSFPQDPEPPPGAGWQDVKLVITYR